MEDLQNLALSFGALFISLIIGSVLVKLRYFNYLIVRRGRYGAIDGLRGYLALLVFIHHFIITWYWKNTGAWERPPEDYFENFGHVGVYIFFMITGFLFTSKLIADNGTTDWYRLYKSRIFRITPLYFAVLVVITIIIFYKTDFTVNVDPILLAFQYLRWFLFHGSVINGFSETKEIIAGVDWTLRYEWLFYCFLPIIALVMSRGKYALALLFAVTFILFFFPQRLISFNSVYFILFSIGGLTAFLISEKQKLAVLFKNKFWSIIAGMAITISFLYPDTQSIIQIALITIFFIPVAFGNTLFGLLKCQGSILLGEISYSIYLLHGMVLYVIFSLMEFESIMQLPLSSYIFLLPVCAVLVVLVSTVTFLSIELPSIKLGKK